jgi:hypothetical protein
VRNIRSTICSVFVVHQGKNHVVELSKDGRIILKLVFEELHGNVAGSN